MPPCCMFMGPPNLLGSPPHLHGSRICMGPDCICIGPHCIYNGPHCMDMCSHCVYMGFHDIYMAPWAMALVPRIEGSYIDQVGVPNGPGCLGGLFRWWVGCLASDSTCGLVAMIGFGIGVLMGWCLPVGLRFAVGLLDPNQL